MYKTILVTLETTPTDRAIIDHIKSLAKLAGSAVVLLHVATGVPAKYHGANAAGEEVEKDSEYLDDVRNEFANAGIPATTELAYGDPVKEIIKWVQRKGCDLVAMSTHGHQFVADLFLGATGRGGEPNISVADLIPRGE